MKDLFRSILNILKYLFKNIEKSEQNSLTISKHWIGNLVKSKEK